MKLDEVISQNSRHARGAVTLATVLCCALVGAACAQPLLSREAPPEQRQAAEVDPPGRVGRLSDVTGQVWLFSPDAGEWVAASRNLPLTSGDRLATDAGARAEMRIGSTTLRLDADAELEVVRLDDERVALRLHDGSLFARLRTRDAASEFEVQTGEGRFRLQRAGRYRFDRFDDASHLTVYSGQSVYEGPRSALTVYAGQRGEFWLDRGNTAQYSITEPRRDDFAAWNGERDRADDRSVSSRYVSPEMTGIEDLDRHGRWEESAEYGPLWIPRGVSPGWAPYSTGRWTWVRPWGWTWVDDAPWGFAPFHYGRWVWLRNNWCWSPGAYVARPVYAPALVAWVGGPQLNLSLSIGVGPAVGWFPLAPREVYLPSYRVSPVYVRNLNVGHAPAIRSVTTYIGNRPAPAPEPDYGNRKFPHAVTIVPSSVVTNRQPVGAAAAQTRDLPAVREFGANPGRAIVSVTVPAGLEAPPPRAVETRPAPPPGRPERPQWRERDDRRMQTDPRAPPAIISVQPNPGLVQPQRPAPPPPAQSPQQLPQAAPSQLPQRPGVWPQPPAVVRQVPAAPAPSPATPPPRREPPVTAPRPDTPPQRGLPPQGQPQPQRPATLPAPPPPRVVPAPSTRPAPTASDNAEPEQDLRKRRHREPPRDERQQSN